MTFRLLMCAVVMCGITSHANAATLTLDSNAFYNTPAAGGVGDVLDQDQVGVSGAATASTSASASGAGASASTSGSIDIATGLSRSVTETTLDQPASTTGISSSAYTSASMTENFTAVGSGMVTFTLAVDGYWDLTRSDGAPGWQAQASLSLGSILSDGFVLNQASSGASGSIDTLLEISFFASDGTDYSITTFLLTQIASATAGIVDFSNTAALQVSMDQGVALQYDDGRFLSQVGVVPLPAGAWMLLTAMLALAALSGRRGKAA